MSDAPRLPHLVEPGSLAREIGERFTASGFEAWLVGGCVRDALLLCGASSNMCSPTTGPGSRGGSKLRAIGMNTTSRRAVHDSA